MIRAVAIALTGLSLTSLAACAAADVPAGRSYSLGRGIVNYDELRRAGDKCKAEGGALQAKQDGGDPAQLSNYTCVIGRSDK
jgi:hypothetical protein